MTKPIPDGAALFREGIHLRWAYHDQEEVKKLGNLRGGETGCMLPDGKVGKSTCMRLVYARQQGLDLGFAGETPWQTELMWSGGRLNEDDWTNSLQRSWVDAGKGSIKREDEIPVAWQTANGTWVRGRPDIVLLDNQGEPVLGQEHKGIFSGWTARDVLNLKPRVDAILQGGHYAMEIGAPWELHYTNRTNFELPGRYAIPVESPELSYEYTLDGRPFRMKITPFLRSWTIRWADGRLYLNNQLTVITESGIRDYYEVLSELGAGIENFPTETIHFDPLTGQASSKWKPEKYCALKKYDEANGTTFCCGTKGCNPNVNDWHAEVVEHVANKKKQALEQKG